MSNHGGSTSNSNASNQSATTTTTHGHGLKRSREPDLFQCPVCYDDMRTPIVECPSCMSVFCQDCITKSFRTTSPACPMCRKETSSPSSWHRNLAIERIISNYAVDTTNSHGSSKAASPTSTASKGSSSGFIQVLVIPLTGKTKAYEVKPGDSIESLKMKIQAKEGVPCDAQRLIFEGRQLQDNKTIKECGIGNCSSIHLVLRLRGGRSRRLLSVSSF